MYLVKPSNLRGVFEPPPSKSYTHRALFVSAISTEKSIIKNPNLSEDVEETINVLSAMGATIRKENNELVVNGGIEKKGDITVRAVASGTTLRFLMALASTRSGRTIIKFEKEIERRPVDSLIKVLVDGGASIKREEHNLIIHGPLKKDLYKVDGSLSSQFISAMLLVAPMIRNEIQIDVDDKPVSMQYINLTIDVMKEAGVAVEQVKNSFHVVSSEYSGRTYTVPGDISSTLPVVVGSVITNGMITLKNVPFSSIQPDYIALDYLLFDYFQIDRGKGNYDLILTRNRDMLSGKSISFRDMPDAFPIFSVLFAFNRGLTIFSDIKRLMLKESDRVKEVCRILDRMKAGYMLSNDNDILKIYEHARSYYFEHFITYDHRIFMAAIIAALAGSETSSIDGSAAKSYPGFIDDLIKLNADIEVV